MTLHECDRILDRRDIKPGRNYRCAASPLYPQILVCQKIFRKNWPCCAIFNKQARGTPSFVGRFGICILQTIFFCFSSAGVKLEARSHLMTRVPSFVFFIAGNVHCPCILQILIRICKFPIDYFVALNGYFRNLKFEKGEDPLYHYHRSFAKCGSQIYSQDSWKIGYRFRVFIQSRADTTHDCLGERKTKFSDDKTINNYSNNNSCRNNANLTPQ